MSTKNWQIIEQEINEFLIKKVFLDIQSNKIFVRYKNLNTNQSSKPIKPIETLLSNILSVKPEPVPDVFIPLSKENVALTDVELLRVLAAENKHDIIQKYQPKVQIPFLEDETDKDSRNILNAKVKTEDDEIKNASYESIKNITRHCQNHDVTRSHHFQPQQDIVSTQQIHKSTMVNKHLNVNGEHAYLTKTHLLSTRPSTNHSELVNNARVYSDVNNAHAYSDVNKTKTFSNVNTTTKRPTVNNPKTHSNINNANIRPGYVSTNVSIIENTKRKYVVKNINSANVNVTSDNVNERPTNKHSLKKISNNQALFKDIPINIQSFTPVNPAFRMHIPSEKNSYSKENIEKSKESNEQKTQRINKKNSSKEIKQKIYTANLSSTENLSSITQLKEYKFPTTSSIGHLREGSNPDSSLTRRANQRVCSENIPRSSNNCTPKNQPLTVPHKNSKQRKSKLKAVNKKDCSLNPKIELFKLGNKEDIRLRKDLERKRKRDSVSAQQTEVKQAKYLLKKRIAIEKCNTRPTTLPDSDDSTVMSPTNSYYSTTRFQPVDYATEQKRREFQKNFFQQLTKFFEE